MRGECPATVEFFKKHTACNVPFLQPSSRKVAVLHLGRLRPRLERVSVVEHAFAALKRHGVERHRVVACGVVLAVEGEARASVKGWYEL